MKKLIIACCIVLVLGVGMTVGGLAAGGQLYGAYYNGALHPVREAVDDAVTFTRDHLRYRWWWADGAWHSGWFSADQALDRAEQVTDEAFDRAEQALDRAEQTLDQYDTDWVDGYLEKRREAINRPYFLPSAALDTVRRLHLDFDSDDCPEQPIRIVFASDYQITGAAVEESALIGSTWSLTLAPTTEEECVLTLPTSLADALDALSLDAGDHPVQIDGSLAAQEMRIEIGRGALSAENLRAGVLDLSVEDGRFAPASLALGTRMEVELDSGSITTTLRTPGDGSDFGYQVETEGGLFLLNGQTVAGKGAANHAARPGKLNGSPILRAEIETGTLDLLTADASPS